MHVSLWPQERAQHPSTEHSDLLIFLDSIFMEEYLSADTGATSLPPLLTEVLLSLLLRCCAPADGRAGRAGEGGVRAGRLAPGHAPSLARWGRRGETGEGNEQKHKQRVTSS